MKDFNGEEISVGDTVIYGIASGYQAGKLRKATITSITSFYDEISLMLIGTKDNGQKYTVFRKPEETIRAEV